MRGSVARLATLRVCLAERGSIFFNVQFFKHVFDGEVIIECAHFLVRASRWRSLFKPLF